MRLKGALSGAPHILVARRWEGSGRRVGQWKGNGRGVAGDGGRGQCRLTTSVCQLRHDQIEQGPTEPHTGRSTFLLSSGGAGGGYYWPLISGQFLLRTSFPAGRQCHVWGSGRK